MKRNIMKLTAAFALVVTFGIATANAQINSNLRANVPFRFTVGNNILPAGDYGVVMTDQVVRIASADDQAGSVGLLSKNDPSGETKLVFHKYGDQYFLAEVWTGSKGITLSESSAEKEMIASSGKHGMQTLAVLLNAIR